MIERQIYEEARPVDGRRGSPAVARVGLAADLLAVRFGVSRSDFSRAIDSVKWVLQRRQNRSIALAEANPIPIA